MTKENTYKLSLCGGKFTLKDLEISEENALRVITIAMGGVGTNNEPRGSAFQASEPETIAIGTNVPSPKMFMAQKKPTSEIERLICLAYYLTKYKDMQVFKSRDLTQLSREAAQPSFSNLTVFARNAVNAQYLAKAGGGSKQITTLGEAVVNALPDRGQVKAAIEENRLSHKYKAKPRKKTQSEIRNA